MELLKKSPAEGEWDRFMELFRRVRSAGGKVNTADSILKGMAVRNTDTDIDPEIAKQIFSDTY